jgi:ribosomal protein S18 acetylase RimI-like enzyme
MTVELLPASHLSLSELADLFTASFEGYAVPMRIDEATFARMAELYDFDLDASRVAVRGGRPVGVVNLGVRGPVGWIGGMGVVPDERRNGVGELLMRGIHAVGRELDLAEIVLEVIDSNSAARGLYAKLGYEDVRDLEIWSLDADPPDTAAREVRAVEAHMRVRELRRGPEPWQRADVTLQRILASDAETLGLTVDGGAAVLRIGAHGVAVEQIAAPDAGTARRLLAGARRAGRPVRLTNVPAGDPVTEAFAALGGQVDLRQVELRLGL